MIDNHIFIDAIVALWEKAAGNYLAQFGMERICMTA
jgi:hypothetical protein